MRRRGGGQADQVVPGDVAGELHDPLADVVDPVLVQPEAVRPVGAVDQQPERFMFRICFFRIYKSFKIDSPPLT